MSTDLFLFICHGRDMWKHCGLMDLIKNMLMNKIKCIPWAPGKLPRQTLGPPTGVLMLQFLQSFRFLLHRVVTQQKQGLKLSVSCVLPQLLSKCHNILKYMPQVLELASVRTSLFSLKKRKKYTNHFYHHCQRNKASVLKKLGNKKIVKENSKFIF